MFGKRPKRWNTCLLWFVTSLGALCLTISCIGAENDGVPDSFSNVEVPLASGNGCTVQNEGPSAANRQVMLVSTLDGKLSALDVKDDGKVLWSVEADSRPLLSSSISKLMILHDKVPTRYIPSLDGGLYKYNGESIEAVPVTAETLLSSSYRLADSTVMVGGKDVKSYGLDVTTGEVRYSCGPKGCHTFGDDVQKEDDLLVITRNTKTVRAVDSRSGSEQWNFSVGEHEVNFLNGQRKQLTDTSGEEDEEGVTVIPCDSEDVVEDLEQLINSIKIVVPEGKVIGVNPENMETVTWQHKFKSPVSNAWLLFEGNLHKVDMFDHKRIPGLSSFDPDELSGQPPLLYVGMHQNQLYVQPSAHIDRVMNVFPPRRTPPRVAWKPYLNTAQYRTQIIQTGNHPGITHKEDKDEKKEDAKEQAVMVWHEHYPFDNGYYLYPDFIESTPPVSSEENASEPKQTKEHSILDDYLPASLWDWWREVLAISIVSSVIVHVVLTHLAHRQAIPSLTSLISISQSDSGEKTNSSSKGQESTGEQENSESMNKQNSESKVEYVSRYATDFEHIQILGKGGFGVVFETKNKVDECHYAVKRISLPNTDGAKEKVMREVRALAKLDHVGIVRFFHAWLESPPLGWQEERDKEVEDSECMSSPTPCNSVSVMGTKDFMSHDNASPSRGQDRLNRKFGGNMNNPFQLNETDLLKKGGSEEFSVQSWDSFDFSGKDFRRKDGDEDGEEDEDDDESGSFSCGKGAPNFSTVQEEVENDNSVSVVFTLSDDEESVSSANKNFNNNRKGGPNTIFNIPIDDFSITNTDSSFGAENTNTCGSDLEIVFEDSGCGDKTSKSSSGGDVVLGIPSSQSNDRSESPDPRPQSFKKSHSRSGSKDLAHLTYETEGRKSSGTKPFISKADSGSKRSTTPKPRLFLFIQMQLCKRETLKDWLSANTLNRDRHMVLDMFDQIVSAVEYVHDCGLMHRDLKPSNIFFSVDGVIKMGDFGLVTALAEEQNEAQLTEDDPCDQKHTAQVGTQLYMSPEQTSGKVYCHKVDIFSLGVILFEMLYPFSTQMERVNTLTNVRKQKLPERFTREMPKESEVVNWLLSSDPVKRPSAKDILQSELLSEFANRRMPSRFRTRTVSQNSL